MTPKSDVSSRASLFHGLISLTMLSLQCGNQIVLEPIKHNI